jgi:hypothetical protein
VREPEYTKKLRILMFISSFLVAYVLLCLLVKIRKFGEVFFIAKWCKFDNRH